MAKKVIQKKKAAGKVKSGWHIKVAYSLGKAASTVSGTLDKNKRSSKRRGTKKVGRRPGTALAVVEPLFGASPEPLSPVIKEIKAIADISGLTEALEEMNRISLKHSRHPVIERVIIKVKDLSPAQQESLSRKFIERLNTTLYFNQAIAQLPSRTKMTEEDCEKLSASFIECIAETLEDLGLPEDDRAVFKKLSGDIAQPINDLMQFYMHPKTFGQKVKRLWRMQRILIRVIKLVRLTNAMQKDPLPNILMEAPPKNISANYWASHS